MRVTISKYCSNLVNGGKKKKAESETNDEVDNT
jgi:hypothetical protein